MSGSPADVHPVLRRAPAPPAAVDQLAHAERLLDHAAGCEDPGDAYVAVHLAALRAAAAVLAVRSRPETTARGRRRIRSVWEMLPEAAPELSEWSTLFTASAARRQRVEAGVRDAVTHRDAAELSDATAMFVRLVQAMVPHQPRLPDHPAPGETA